MNKYEQLAETAVNNFANKKIPLNASISKIASEQSLNPEEIKRIVERANVRAFQHQFENREDKNSNVNFDLADSQKIIDELFSSDESNIPEDKASQDVDFFSDVPFKSDPCSCDSLPKEESPSSVPALDKNIMIIKIQKAAEELQGFKTVLSSMYIAHLSKLKDALQSVYSENYSMFKEAALKEDNRLGIVLKDLEKSIEKKSHLFSNKISNNIDPKKIQLIKEALEKRLALEKVVKAKERLDNGKY